MKWVATRFAVLSLAALAVGGCGLFSKDARTTPVVGERLPVLGIELDVDVDPATAALPMNLPAPVANSDWGQSGGNASKSMGHVALGSSLGLAYSVSIGQGSTSDARLVSAPVVSNGRVFTIDTTGTVRAFDAQSGAEVWATRFGEVGRNSGAMFGGGVAAEGGRVYATNGLGYVAALDPTNGGIIWQERPGGPLRGSPTVTGDTLYVMSHDNQIYSLNAASGATNWSSAASLEIAGVFGIAAPAFAQGTVVAGFSSGELNAYRYENGRLVWQDQLLATGIRTSVASLSDIDADPVIDNGRVFAIGQGGRMVALELISGQRVWELNIAGTSTPWVAGEWVFVVTSDAKLMAIHRDTGKVRWMTQLRRYENDRRRSGPVSYSGPVLAGNRLIVVNSEGALIYADPATGTVQGQTDIGSGVSLSPVVANSTLYILDDSGRLHAFR